MATPTPTLHIKSAARKLPIKRKSSSDPNPSPIPIANPTPDLLPLALQPEADAPLAVLPPDSGYDDEDDDDAEDDDESEYGSAAAAGIEGAPGGSTAAGDLRSPPFKFHRIWSESDEIRFLQGLLGCWSQGMVFPRDLNLFYDRFSESMPQPYTRSQLSEKLRRLRKKFRIIDVAGKEGPGSLVARTILDVFDGCLKELQATLNQQELLASPDGALASGSEESELLRRWRKQQVAEMDVLARRLRLVLETAIKN
ncbi:putative undifferentiated embryonic cell transcription factor 1-like [Cocos nucifera]|nr:putative undifferentiated embryonic cell transcription factor 1-like [Cocos nucifera]